MQGLLRLAIICCILLPCVSLAQEPVCPEPGGILTGPTVSTTAPPTELQPALPEEGDRALPINLATALRLADARPLVIQAAEAGVEIAVARLDQARVLWLPTIYTGVDYQRHDGGAQNEPGNLIINGRQTFLAGGGAMAVFATTDAIFLPLAQRQVLRAQQFDVQTAKNDALLRTAETFFNVQQARGRLAGAQDVVAKARELTRRVEALGRGLTPAVEADRVRTLLAEAEGVTANVRGEWRVASANLTRVLRLDPGTIVQPTEPPYLQVTLIGQQSVDALIPVGLLNRPELAAQQALVQATLERIRQERLRPLIPSIVLQGNAAPGGRMTGGLFGSGSNGMGNPWTGRSDVDLQVLWELRNLGLGNRALVRERRAEQQRALIELFDVQDQVAAEVAQAHAQVEAALVRVTRAEVGVREGVISYQGNLRGLGETLRVGDLLQLVVRPQEAVAALQQLAQAYDIYFLAVNDYNRAQFRLFRALGYPARILACEKPLGPIQPVDTTRPPQMAPVCGPEPCQGCPPR